MQYLFILGSTPKLSIAELESFYPSENLKLITPQVLCITSGTSISEIEIMDKLGGTVKICEVIKSLSEKKDLDKEISVVLKLMAVKNKIVFGISKYLDFNLGNIKGFCKNIKYYLEEEQIKSRFVLPLGETLTSVQVSKQKLTEIVLVSAGNKILLARTLIVQEFEGWSKRDYKRPEADPKSGMLPPKVARIMLNMVKTDKSPENPFVVLDPFCGMGTIGAEGLMLGYWVILSDKYKEVVQKAEKNLHWLCKSYNISGENFTVHISDARTISKLLPRNSLDAIVTEPFLGPPVNYFHGREMFDNRKITPGRILAIFNELEELYLAAFQDWQNVLKPEAKVAIIFPSFRIGQEEYFLKNIIDSCEKLGYNVISGPFAYGHPQSVLRRNIYIFQNRTRK